MSEYGARDYANEVAQSIEEHMTAFAKGDGSWAENDAVQEALDEYPLEVVYMKGAPFEVVITVGGPDARIVHDVRWSDWKLEVVWGGDSAVRRSEHITAMGEYFLSLVDEDA